jgi:hypothetical protein
MEQLLTQLLQDLLYALVSLIIGFGVSLLHKYNGSAKLQKIQQELATHEDLAKGVILAVQSIYTDLNGGAKLDQATKMLSSKLDSVGIKLSAVDIRGLIESTLVKAKSEFQDAWSKEAAPIQPPEPTQPEVQPVEPLVPQDPQQPAQQ